MSAVAVLTIAGGIVTDGARSKALLVAGATSSTVAATLRKRGDILNLEEELKRQRDSAASAREEAERETKKYEELLHKARKETYSKAKEAEYLARIANLEQDLAAAEASAGKADDNAAAALQRANNLEEELKRQRQVAKKAEKDVKVPKNKISDSQTGEREAVEKEDTAKQYAILTAFGMFWSREAVKWSSNPKLFGIKPNNETLPVDFSQKCAIYFLHDRRKIIYVRITNRLGKSLCAHINDSLSKSWDRFSWLHLTSSVPSSGTLGRQPSSYDDSQVKLVLAAILIEVWEKRDHLKHAEYLQKVDPA